MQIKIHNKEFNLGAETVRFAEGSEKQLGLKLKRAQRIIVLPEAKKYLMALMVLVKMITLKKKKKLISF